MQLRTRLNTCNAMCDEEEKCSHFSHRSDGKCNLYQYCTLQSGPDLGFDYYLDKTFPSTTSENAVASVRSACDGKTVCKYLLRKIDLGDPDPQCEEEISIKYQCGNGATHV